MENRYNEKALRIIEARRTKAEFENELHRNEIFKKMRKMSASYISQYAEIPVQTVRRAISSLINKNFLISKSNGHNLPIFLCRLPILFGQ